MYPQSTPLVFETKDEGRKTKDARNKKTFFGCVPHFSSLVPRPSSFVFRNAILFFFLISALPGCGPKYTYLADAVPASIQQICHDEYKLEVIGRVEGKTAGALYYVDDILDDKGQIPKEIHEKMGQIMQAVTRVSLSTDLPVDYCVVVIRDRAHLNELTITRSLDDTKRANSDAIGVEESINRTLFGQGKYQLPSDGEKNFVMKEVKQEYFLAEQIAQRVRFGIAKDSKDTAEEAAPQQSLTLVDGVFNQTGTERKFRFSILSLKTEEAHEPVLNILKTIKDVLGGYQFYDFDSIEVLDYLNRQKLEISKQVFLDYQNKKITEQEILDKYLTESQTMQEAFKLFGFNLGDAPDAAEAAPAIGAATP